LSETRRVIIYPTDTVYGIGCDINNRKEINDEGDPIRISDRVKERYYERMGKNGKGLLDYEVVK